MLERILFTHILKAYIKAEEYVKCIDIIDGSCIIGVEVRCVSPEPSDVVQDMLV